ncbi:DUF874 domain-containing protein [Roseovarius nanhaiticus]|uniref:DUF874 domain-containing protein n=1 Tax=Roseovarius nanhaiticus TaxID=573024 RepID=UPI00249387D6|nr:DUF874 domain-containing protein [Roseovarius nanhaiticus]
MGSIFSIADFLDMLRRRRGLIAAVFLLGCVLSLLFAASQRHLYSSSEVLQMQGAVIPGEMAPSTVQGSSARRLQLIEQQVMSRGAILELIEEFKLFSDQPGLTEAEQVSAIREAVNISGVAAARDGYRDDGEVSLLRISATWPTAEGARLLAHEVSQRTVSLSVSSRLEQSRETLDFFTLQEDTALREVQALEREISQFRARNDIALPSAAESVQREIAALNEALLTIDRQMIALQRQIAQPAESRIERRAREEQRAELDGLAEERALLERNIDALSASIAGTSEAQARLVEYDRQLEALQDTLAAATARRKEAETAYRLETQRQAERLTVLEPAVEAQYPFTRSRKSLAILGALVSAVAAVGAAFLMDLRHPVIRSAAQMEHALGLRPVVSIPRMQPQRRRRRSLLDRIRRR